MSDDNSKPMISVVVTTYNHARYLPDAIDSVLAQDVAADEIIVVDDGSSDDPASVVARYQSVAYVRQQNQGLSAARNTGWRKARGRFVTFLDADDRLRPNALSTNLNQFENFPDCAFVYGAYSFIEEGGRHLALVPFTAIGDDAFRSFLTGNRVGMHATVLYRRECLEKAGGFDTTLPACEDYDLYLRLSRLYPVASTSAWLAEYRRHGANMSNNIL